MKVLPGTLRGRLVAAYAIGLSVVVIVVLAAGYLALVAELRHAAEEDLAIRLDDVSAAVETGDLLPVGRDPYAQVIAGGAVVARSAATPSTPVLTLKAAGEVVEQKSPGLRGTAMLAARRLPDGRLLVVGTSLATVDATAQRVLIGLAMIGPALVLVLTLAVRRVVGGALGPVAAMTSRARELNTGRLPEPPGTDEIATLARTLNEMLDRIDAANQRERAFLDDAAHELRTPVAVLRAELELGLADDDPRQAMRAALVEADRLSRLATDLLVIARARAGTLELDRGPTDATVVVRDAAQRVARLHGLAVEVTGQEVVAEVDAVRLEQVVTNLVGNAAQARAGRVRVAVAQSAAGALVVTVDDDGPGFPEELLPVAFDRFRGTPGGSGLGLAIVATVARAHGGDAVASNASALGGARVRVSFGS
ncbi:HAMP domain-containing sensor histidine kinase [Phytohabitans rumicis]|uniref:HAMP domain-containing sensor histidine kinase n=1 Tax=Phytohabitans rumicis TaxID=1076125 RepID=UPI001566255A|nr:HAMP domain-containing sensor histidine kinase [Phytohabitans rumicis]